MKKGILRSPIYDSLITHAQSSNLARYHCLPGATSGTILPFCEQQRLCKTALMRSLAEPLLVAQVIGTFCYELAKYGLFRAS